MSKSRASVPAADVSAQKMVDPGCLPAWDVDDLPEPVPFRARNWIALIGPGLVMAGGSIGTGEWVMGPKAAAQYEGAMFWVVILSILAQVVVNTEVMRYTLCTGEPIMTGFMRTKPGPRFWLPFYIILDFGSWWPALAGLAAQILVVAWQGLGPTDIIDPETVRFVSYGVFMTCAVMVLFGGKVYNTLEWVLGSKVLFVLVYMVICSVFFVSLTTWGKMWGGLINPFNLAIDPKTDAIDWTLISALAGYSGVGGMGNMMASNFVREKGWGMGSKVGAIPSAFGGHKITLSHIGTMCRPGPLTAERFKGWYAYLIPDQYILWAVGSLFAMMLPSMLGAQYLNTGSLSGAKDWQWAAQLAQDFGGAIGGAMGNVFRILTLICGLVILIPGQFSTVDGISRRWTDAVWSSTNMCRKMDTSKVKWVYYTFAGTYVLWGISAYTFFPTMSASTMMVIAGNMANLALSATIFHTLYVTTRFLPKEVQPTPLKRAAMVCAGLFFITMFGLVVNQRILPVVGPALRNLF